MHRIIRNDIYIGADGRKSLFDLEVPENWNNKLIIFLHGYMGFKDWGAWHLVQSFFTASGYAFLKYNVSHNGGTVENGIDFPDLEAFSKNTYIKELIDFEAILNTVQLHFEEIPDIYLIGHSRGGGIALLNSDNGFIKKIVTWAAISDIRSRFPKGKELEYWESDGYLFKLNSRTKQQMPHQFVQYSSFLENNERLNIMDYCKRSTTPTLVVHGDADESVSINEGKDIARWLGAELEVIPGAQHTFGTSHPWDSSVLPKAMQLTCEKTMQFFKGIEDIDQERSEINSLLADLVKLAKSDNEVRENEFQFLLSIASQLGVTKEEFLAIFKSYIEFNPPKLEFDRIVQLQRLILLMNVDLHVDEKEIELIKDLGIKMGLHPSATNEVLARMHEYPNKIIPPDILLGIFNTFHN